MRLQKGLVHDNKAVTRCIGYAIYKVTRLAYICSYKVIGYMYGYLNGVMHK